LLPEVVAGQRGADLAAGEQRMIVHHAHRAAEYTMAEGVVVALAAPVRGEEVMQVQRERRHAGLAGTDLTRHVLVAPCGVDDGLIQEHVQLRLGDVLAREVERLRRDLEIGKLGVERRNTVEQQVAQRRCASGDGERVAHRCAPRFCRY
jgi:hypothetical protein